MTISIETKINAPISKVWEYWTQPKHIIHWNFASEEWHCPHAVNDIRPGGELNWRMEAKDGSMGFDFIGKYESIDEEKSIVYTIADGRKVEINFTSSEGVVHLIESFEAEDIHTAEMQKTGWQAILENFKKYVETS